MSSQNTYFGNFTITFMGVFLLIFSSIASSSSYIGTGKSSSFKAGSTNVVYESRNAVQAKAKLIKRFEKGCGKVIKRFGPWRVLSRYACKGEKAYKTAAKKRCKMKVTVTTNRNSQYSFDRSRASFRPYACLR